jgi:hypothetical protein
VVIFACASLRYLYLGSILNRVVKEFIYKSALRWLTPLIKMKKLTLEEFQSLKTRNRTKTKKKRSTGKIHFLSVFLLEIDVLCVKTSCCPTSNFFALNQHAPSFSTMRAFIWIQSSGVATKKLHNTCRAPLEL